MRNSFDYYKQVEKPNMYLCNPDQTPIGFVNSENRHLVLRFNDLSELSFTVPKINGTESIYQRIETRRLLFIEKIGWFQITNVEESIEGDYEHKQVTAESHQTQLKSRGFISEERVYMFYNPNDPLDKQYDSSNPEGIPSVVGQLYQQIGLKVNLMVGDIEPNEDFVDWTLIYLDPALQFRAQSYDKQYTSAKDADNICRSFEKKETFGYDFIVNDVENAFEVVVEFDYLHHSIKVKRLAEITIPTNIYLSLDNVMQSLKVTENAENIVTVLSCNGNDLDIRTVNPMGTNYIVNFDYYKKEVSDDGKIKFPWMSEQLINSLKAWQIEWERWKSDDDSRVGHEKGYSSLVEDIQKLYVDQADIKADIQYANLKLTDLQAARDQYLKDDKESEEGAGIVSPEDVKTGTKSLSKTSSYYNVNFSESATLTAYKTAPTHTKKENRYEFAFSTDGKTGSAQSMLLDFMGEEKDNDGNWSETIESTSCLYFMDDSSKASYCKLLVSSEVGVIKDSNGNISGNGSTELRGVKFSVISMTDRFTITFPDGSSLTLSKSAPYFVYGGIRYKIIQSVDGITTIYCFYVSGFRRFTTYQELTGETGWCVLWEQYIKVIDKEDKVLEDRIKTIEDEMAYISEICNIQKYIKRCGDGLYRELSNYWVEGEFKSDNLAAFDSTSIAERIELAKELMEAGAKELEKVSQPTFKLSVSAINFIKLLEFKSFTDELELGRVITIEKDERTHYRPALVSIEYDLDSVDSFSLTFSTAAKLSESAMTFADLLNTASSTSRTISANWSNLTDYWKNKDKITSMLNAPLDRTLRAAQANMANQEFTIDTTGILGRKWSDDSHTGFNPEQVRIINNTIIFTDDNWKTVRTALGKITYDDYDESGSSQEKQAYGLLAEVLVGSLIMGEKLHIINEDNSIALDNNGISIKNSSQDLVFLASTSGNVYVKGDIYATSLTLADGVTIEYSAIGDAPDLSKYVLIQDGAMQTSDYKYSSGKYSTAGMRIDLKNQYIRTKNFAIDSTGLLYAKGVTIQNGVIQSDDFEKPSDDVYATTGMSIDLSNGYISTPNFAVDDEGILYARGAEISGTISAEDGTIGDLVISGGALKGYNSGQLTMQLSNDGLYLPQTASLRIGNTFTSGYDGNAVYWKTTGALYIYGGEESYISLLTSQGGSSTVAVTVTKGSVSYQGYSNGTHRWTLPFTITLSARANNPINFILYYRWIKEGKYLIGSTGINIPSGTMSLTHTISYTSGSKGSVTPTTQGFTINVPITSNNQSINNDAKSITISQSNSSNIITKGNLYPSDTSGTYTLGSSSHPWNCVYANSTTISTSDRNKKSAIRSIDKKYSLLFDKLRPATFKLNDGTSGRLHMGLVAQEVQKAMEDLHIDAKDLAAFCSWKNEDESTGFGLRYEEFIALSIYEIQKLKKRIERLERIKGVKRK